MLVLVGEGSGGGQMACSGRGSGMRTEWVRRMGLEQGARQSARRAA